MKKNFEVICCNRYDFENPIEVSKPMTWNEALHDLKLSYYYATRDDWEKTVAIRKIGDIEPYSIEYVRDFYSKFYN
jgi:hypothetical protein